VYAVIDYETMMCGGQRRRPDSRSSVPLRLLIEDLKIIAAHVVVEDPVDNLPGYAAFFDPFLGEPLLPRAGFAAQLINLYLLAADRDLLGKGASHGLVDQAEGAYPCAFAHPVLVGDVACLVELRREFPKTLGQFLEDLRVVFDGRPEGAVLQSEDKIAVVG
jgi:hypothetical protein